MNPTIKQHHFAILIFDGADMLDFNGTNEDLESRQQRQPDSHPHRANRQRHQTNRRPPHPRLVSIPTYDILLIPGTAPSLVHALVEADKPEKELIRTFASASSPKPRILFSICTGSFLLGAAGILAGTTVTTHQHALDVLRSICAAHGTGLYEKTRVVRRRFVDGGFVRGTRVQVITAGGISSGLEATFYIICLLLGAERASWVSREMEYGWKESEDGVWPAKLVVGGGGIVGEIERRVPDLP
ncbi:ThiJ/PfpI family protein [Penicillium argentinense]|uniref:ThiJ/PfpI family protein n=1 Tax=Penicillium argentinense TaxID=1131581 RepID=A0A9W9G0Y7_9EURO|nr:ThiJ/PfpI family protein [Penicillium argentinense]KAJ5109625.1 ThiJ/PfpI family protein [Penicillium argentinense]